MLKMFTWKCSGDITGRTEVFIPGQWRHLVGGEVACKKKKSLQWLALSVVHEVLSLFPHNKVICN